MLPFECLIGSISLASGCDLSFSHPTPLAFDYFWILSLQEFAFFLIYLFNRLYILHLSPRCGLRAANDIVKNTKNI